MIYLSTAIWLSPGGSSTVHLYTQTIHRTTQNKISRQSACEGGKAASRKHRPPLPPGNIPGTNLCSEAESTSGS